MSKSIKELADALGVSKTAIRKHMTPEIRCEHTETDRNGVITIDSAGCKLIAESMGRSEKLSETTENKFSETPESSENLVIPKVVWDALQAQLATLQAQLTTKDQQIKELSKIADQAQQLHAGEIQQLRLEAGKLQDEPAVDVQQAEPEQMKRRGGFFAWLKGE